MSLPNIQCSTCVHVLNMNWPFSLRALRYFFHFHFPSFFLSLALASIQAFFPCCVARHCNVRAPTELSEHRWDSELSEKVILKKPELGFARERLDFF